MMAFVAALPPPPAATAAAAARRGRCAKPVMDVNPAAAPRQKRRARSNLKRASRPVQKSAVGGVEGGVVGGVIGGIVGGLRSGPAAAAAAATARAGPRRRQHPSRRRRRRDVKPVYPAIAQSARVQGVVIIEATIGPNGAVQEAKVLRSIPLLDAAALDAVQPVAVHADHC